jgi:hypothetical protein
VRKDNTIEAFFALVRAGLFPVHGEGFRVNESLFQDVELKKIYQLAQEQSVQGLVLAGLEQYKNLNADLAFNIPKVLLLQWIGEVQAIEQKNRAMNAFINQLIGDLRKVNIYTLIVKGQGVAQCYERPLWRASGDIDFYMNDDDFQKAKIFFRPLVDKFDPDDDYTRHINMHYGEWVVEIHANQNCSLSPRINRVMNEVHNDLFYRGNVRSWDNNGMQIFLPSADNDALIIFTHFFNHFYRGGVGLRQICDWCRLLYTYRDSLNYGLLEQRIKRAGLLDEWRAFGAFAVKYLGMPIEAMPLLNDNLNANLNRKADKICDFILEVGNFGHNRDMSYYGKYPFLIRKAISASWRLKDWLRHARIFPMDSLRFLFGMTVTSFKAVSHGE